MWELVELAGLQTQQGTRWRMRGNAGRGNARESLKKEHRAGIGAPLQWARGDCRLRVATGQVVANCQPGSTLWRRKWAAARVRERPFARVTALPDQGTVAGPAGRSCGHRTWAARAADLRNAFAPVQALFARARLIHHATAHDADPKHHQPPCALVVRGWLGD